MAFSIKIKVYYEDTDAGGVVYHANHLKFMERARTELLAANGVSIAELHGNGIFLVAARVELKYIRPARLGDIIEVTAEPDEIKNVSTGIRQRFYKDGELIADAHITLACIDKSGRPRKFPEEFMRVLSEGMASEEPS